MKTDCIQIYSKTELLPSMDKPVQDRIISHIFGSPKSRYSLIIIKGSKQCRAFRDYLISMVENQYHMKPIRIYTDQVHYYDNEGEIRVYIVNGMSKSLRGKSCMVNFIYLDATINNERLDAIRECTSPLLHAKGSLMVDFFFNIGELI